MVESKAAILGHPIHPMLVMFPAALFPVALVFDVVWLVTRDAFWLAAAFWTLAVGVALTAVAAVPGLIDYLNVVPKSGEVRRTATMHMWNGVSILALAAVSLWLRWSAGAHAFRGADAGVAVGTAYWGIGVLLVATLLVVLQGWWGGELVYRHRIGIGGVGVEPRDTDVKRRVDEGRLGGGGSP